MAKAAYIHGTDTSEQARLALLNRMTNEHFIKFLELDGAGFVLEVGSGLGLLAEKVARLVPDGKIYGLEYSARQLASVRTDLPNLYFIQGDAHALPLADEGFDVVYCRYVLEHVADPLQVLREMRRVLRRGGRIFVQENNILINVLYPECPHFDGVWQKFALLQERLGGDALIGKKLFSLLKKAGFQEIQLSIQPEIHYSGCSTFRPWIENQIGNIQSGAEELQKNDLASEEEITQAIAELQAFVERDDASALFYWNRASGIN